MSTLPDYCLRIIFLELPVVQRVKLQRVCKQWKRIGDDCWREVRDLTIFWKHPSQKFSRIDGDARNFVVNATSEKFLNGLIKCCAPFIRKLTVGSGAVSLILPVLKKSQQIEKLIISIPTVDIDTQLGKVFLRNRLIKSLEIQVYEDYKCLRTLQTNFLKNLWIDFYSEDDEIIESFCRLVKRKIRNAPLLHELALKNCLNDEVIRETSNKENLKTLSILTTFCSELTATGLNYISQLSNLSQIKVDVECTTLITDEFLQNLSKNCGKLERIELSTCYEVTDQGLSSLALLPQLQELCLHNTEKITDPCLLNLSKLKTLMLFNTCNTAAGFVTLLCNSACLQRLVLSVKSTFDTENLRRTVEEIVNIRDNSPPLKVYVDLKNILDESDTVEETADDKLPIDEFWGTTMERKMDALISRAYI